MSMGANSIESHANLGNAKFRMENYKGRNH
jgi:hypothetical protein